MKTVLLSFLLCVSFVGLYAQSMFEKRYVYDTYNDKATAVLTLPNGHSLITGRVGDADNPHIFLMELDVSGEIIWSKEYKTSPHKNLWARALRATNNGFIIAGDTEDGGGSEFFVLKVNTQGNTQYIRFFNTSPGWLVLSDLDIASNNDMYLTGFEAVYGSSAASIFFLKLSASGSLQYSKRISRLNSSLKGTDIQCTADGGFILCGSVDAEGEQSEAVLLKFDATGEQEWAKSYKDLQSGSQGRSVKQCADQGFIVGGTIFRPLPSGGDPVSYTGLFKTNADGTIQWSKGMTYGYTNDVIQESDGGFVLMGSLPGTATDGLPSGMFLVKTDASGTVLRSKYYGENAYVSGYGLAQTGDGGFLMAGQSDASSNGDVYVIKTDAAGHALCHENDFAAKDSSNTVEEDTLEILISNVSVTEPTRVLYTSNIQFTVPAVCFAGMGMEEEPLLPVSVFPNPSTGIFYVGGTDPNRQLVVIDVSGRQIATFVNTPSVDLSHFPDGIYFLRVHGEKSAVVQKIVLQH